MQPPHSVASKNLRLLKKPSPQIIYAELDICLSIFFQHSIRSFFFRLQMLKGLTGKTLETNYAIGASSINTRRVGEISIPKTQCLAKSRKHNSIQPFPIFSFPFI